MTLYAEYLIYQAAMCDRVMLWNWDVMLRLSQVMWERKTPLVRRGDVESKTGWLS